MRNFSIFATLLFCGLAANSYAQDVYWRAADGETIPLEPASLHAGRVYHPAVGGGGMHVQIDSRYPVTVAMAWADEWNAAMRQTVAPANFSFLCVKEHVTSAIYECHLPSERPMIITFRDERKPEKPVLATIGAILGPGARQFISPNDLHIQYYNCIQPEFHWRRTRTSVMLSTKSLAMRHPSATIRLHFVRAVVGNASAYFFPSTPKSKSPEPPICDNTPP